MWKCWSPFAGSCSALVEDGWSVGVKVMITQILDLVRGTTKLVVPTYEWQLGARISVRFLIAVAAVVCSMFIDGDIIAWFLFDNLMIRFQNIHYKLVMCGGSVFRARCWALRSGKHGIPLWTLHFKVYSFLTVRAGFVVKQWTILSYLFSKWRHRKLRFAMDFSATFLVENFKIKKFCWKLSKIALSLAIVQSHHLQTL